jgi:hypothetical protein
MSPTTVHKFIKINASTLEKAQPTHKTGKKDEAASSVDATTNNDIDWSKLFPDDPLDDQTPRRDIRGNQLYMGSNNYPEDINYDHQDYAPRLPGIPIPPRKQQTLEASITEIKKEIDHQKKTRILQSLERKIDRISESEREKSEMGRKLTIDQNNKTVSDSLNKIAAPNQDKKDKITSHGTELQKTTKSVEHTKLTNHESTHTDKNIPIHDHNNDKSAVLGTEMAPLLLAKGFEGASPFIGSLIVHKLNKVKFNNITPKKVKLILSQKAKIIHPIKVHLRKIRKEGEIKLTPLDK